MHTRDPELGYAQRPDLIDAIQAGSARFKETMVVAGVALWRTMTEEPTPQLPEDWPVTDLEPELPDDYARGDNA
jgi:hypothetical protein